jgi:hypothetical protein
VASITRRRARIFQFGQCICGNLVLRERSLKEGDREGDRMGLAGGRRTVLPDHFLVRDWFRDRDRSTDGGSCAIRICLLCARFWLMACSFRLEPVYYGTARGSLSGSSEVCTHRRAKLLTGGGAYVPERNEPLNRVSANQCGSQCRPEVARGG